MKQVVIENPIINSPFEEPRHHFRFTDEGITNEINDERRSSSYFIPIPRPKKKLSAQAELFETESHDASGRLDTVSDSSGGTIADYDYIGGRLLKRTMGGGVNLDLRNGSGTYYDSAGQALQWRHVTGGLPGCRPEESKSRAAAAHRPNTGQVPS